MGSEEQFSTYSANIRLCIIFSAAFRAPLPGKEHALHPLPSLAFAQA